MRLSFLLLLITIVLPTMASAQTDYEVTTSEWPERSYLIHRDTVEMAHITPFFMEYLPAIFQTLATSGASPSSEPSGLYWSYDEEAGTADMAAASAFEGTAPENMTAGMEVYKTPATTVLSVDYFGVYENLIAGHSAIEAYMQQQEIGPQMLVIEEYVTDPTTEPDSLKWLTRIHYLLED